jgi:hypothetical protein
MKKGGKGRSSARRSGTHGSWDDQDLQRNVARGCHGSRSRRLGEVGQRIGGTRLGGGER